MSEEKAVIKIIDCTKSCKMTSEMRSSKFCNGKARVVDGSVFYGCNESIKNEEKSVRQFYSCDLWNMDLKESCLTCPLECINNQNEGFARVLEEKKKLDKVIDNLRPNMLLYGVTAGQVEGISSKYTKKQSDGKRDKLGSEAISAANFANEALKMILNGRRIDLAYFALYAKKKSGRIKRLSKGKKKS